jgi:hypothetical protein
MIQFNAIFRIKHTHTVRYLNVIQFLPLYVGNGHKQTCFGTKNTNYTLAIFQASLQGNYCDSTYTTFSTQYSQNKFWLLKPVHDISIHESPDQKNSSIQCPIGPSRSRNPQTISSEKMLFRNREISASRILKRSKKIFEREFKQFQICNYGFFLSLRLQ